MPPCASLPCAHPSLPRSIAIPPQVLLCSTLVAIPQHQGLEQHVNTECATTTGRCTNSCSMSCCTQAKCGKHLSPSPHTSLTPLELLQQPLCCPPFHLLTSMHTCAASPPLVPKCSTDHAVPPLSWAHVLARCVGQSCMVPRTCVRCLHSMLMLRDGWANGLQVRLWCGMAW